MGDALLDQNRSRFHEIWHPVLAQSGGLARGFALDFHDASPHFASQTAHSHAHGGLI